VGIQNYQGLVNFLITLILATVFLIIIVRRFNSVIMAVLTQGLLLVVLCITLGWATGIYEMYIAAFIPKNLLSRSF